MKNYIIDQNRPRHVFIIHSDCANTGLDALAPITNKLRELGYIPVVPIELFDGIDYSLSIDIILEGMVSSMALCPTVVMQNKWEEDSLCNTLVNIARLMEKKCVHANLIESKLKSLIGETSPEKGYKDE